MSRHTCTACRQPIANGEAHIRTNAAFQQVAWCKPCAEDRGLIEFPTLAERIDAAGAQLVTEVEAFAAQVAS